MSHYGAMAALEALHVLEDFTERLTFSEGEEIRVELEEFEIGRKYLFRSPTETLDTGAISELSSDLRRVEVMNQVFRALVASSTELLSLCKRKLERNTSKLSNGLASLHDHILALIFKFVVFSNEESTVQALWLSHVSRRFRRLSLGDQTLWSNLCLRIGTMKASTKASIVRAGISTDIHMTLKNRLLKSGQSVDAATLRDFMSLCTSTASRWRTLSVDGTWMDSQVSITEELLLLMKERRLKMPRLEEISFRSKHTNWGEDADGEFAGTPVWVSPTAAFNDIRTWEAPVLRTLRCTQYIPPPSFPFKSFRTFELSLWLLPSSVRDQVAEMVAFLPSQPNILEFILKLKSGAPADYISDDALDPGTITCPIITSFQLTISRIFSALQIDDACTIAAPIANAFCMPKLRNYTLSIEVEELGGDFTDIGFLTGLFLPDPNHHPLLTCFTFNGIVAGPKKPRSSYAKSVEFDFPLDKLPRVSTICVTTFGWVSFSRRRRADQDASEEQSSLRELQLRSCKHMDAEGLDAMVDSLKDVGAWDTLERVVIRDCNLLQREVALEIVGEERLYFSES